MTARPSRRPPQPRWSGSVSHQAVPWGAGRVAVLGVDPATRNLGLVALGWRGELLDWLEWQLPKTTLGVRVQAIRDGLHAVIRELRPAVVAYERGAGAHPAPEADVIITMLPAWCEEAGVDSASYVPSSWRKTVCGFGGYRKEEAWEAMALTYPQFRCIEGADAKDAYGIAMCWLESNRTPLAQALTAPGARMVKVRRTTRSVS